MLQVEHVNTETNERYMVQIQVLIVRLRCYRDMYEKACGTAATIRYLSPHPSTAGWFPVSIEFSGDMACHMEGCVYVFASYNLVNK